MMTKDEEISKFLLGLGFKPKTEQGSMINDYCEWREEQDPFVDDKEFFIQRYKIDPDPILKDLFTEIFLLRKHLGEIVNGD